MSWNWKELEFKYYQTGGENARMFYKDGRWGEVQYTTDEYIPMRLSSTCLHYGLQAFEGLKAFRGADGSVRLFRPEENARRMQAASRRLCLPEVSTETFVEVCKEVVRRNIDLVPPYGTGASLYLRPQLFGTSPCLGVQVSKEAAFTVFATPVGPYFKGGIKPISVLLDKSCDRAAEFGTGAVKVGGNYASGLMSLERAHKMGYSTAAYADPIEHKYIEECGAANFFGIKGDAYITPKSDSILPSITNMSLRQLALDLGLTVEERPVAVAELGDFSECGACGTGAIITPIGKIYDLQEDKTYEYGNEIGEISQKLYNALQDIQYGRVPDRHGWLVFVE